MNPLPFAAALLLGTLPVAAAEPGPAPGTAESPPDAGEIALSAARFLAGQPAFSLRWFVSYDEVVEGREKLTYLTSGETFMLRGRGFVSHTERGDTYRDYYFDGATFTMASPNEAFYASTPFDGSFDDLVAALRARTGTVLPLWSMMSETLPERILDDVEGAAYLGVTLVEGALAHHLAFATYDEDWQVWISTDQDEPAILMLIGTDRTEQGWPQYRARFLEWDFAPEIDPAVLTYVPGEDEARVTLPPLEFPATEDAPAERAPGTDPGLVQEGDATDAPEPDAEGN